MSAGDFLKTDWIPLQVVLAVLGHPQALFTAGGSVSLVAPAQDDIGKVQQEVSLSWIERTGWLDICGFGNPDRTGHAPRGGRALCGGTTRISVSSRIRFDRDSNSSSPVTNSSIGVPVLRRREE